MGRNRVEVQTLYSMLFLLLFCACDDKPSPLDITTCEINVGDLVCDTVSFEDQYSEVKIIPLEDCKGAILSDVLKMIVTDDKFILLDENVSSNVILFDHNGKYQGRVGGLGHGRGEYEYVFDISTDCDNNIILSTFNDFMVFDQGGKFCHSHNTSSRAYMKDMLCHRNGIVCASNYSGGNSLVHFYDRSFQLLTEQLSSNGNEMRNPPRISHTLQADGNLLCYCNPYDSELTTFGLNEMQPLQKYKLKSENMLTFDRAKEEDTGVDIGNVDGISSYYIQDEEIVANLIFQDRMTILKIDTHTDKCHFSYQKGWIPQVYDRHDGMYYSIISHDKLVDIISGLMPMTESGRKMITDAYNNVSVNMREQDNHVVLQMKKACI